jgi:hypothetical protein
MVPMPAIVMVVLSVLLWYVLVSLSKVTSFVFPVEVTVSNLLEKGFSFSVPLAVPVNTYVIGVPPATLNVIGTLAGITLKSELGTNNAGERLARAKPTVPDELGSRLFA